MYINYLVEVDHIISINTVKACVRNTLNDPECTHSMLQ